MKKALTYKNGFPKPAGMILIAVVITLTCALNLAMVSNSPEDETVSSSVTVQEDDNLLGLSTYPDNVSNQFHTFSVADPR